MRAIDVSDLTGNPGASMGAEIAEPAPTLRRELASVPEGTFVKGTLVLESVPEGIVARGRLSMRLALSCARCLREFEEDLAVEIRGDLFAPGGGDDEYPLDPEGVLDPEPMIRDAFLLAIPFSPLCRPDCRGLCERCGGDGNLGECSCGEAPIDPRWTALSAFAEQREGSTD